MRKLASARRVWKIEPIPGADNIELAHIDGWQVVVRKGEMFREGDLGIYFEIGSKLPEEDWAEFMRPRGFKVKTIKLRGVLSQGLLIPLERLQIKDAKEGEDLTARLKVQRIGDVSEDDNEYKMWKNKKQSWWRRLWPFPRKKNRQFPKYIPKTDEERVQNIANLKDLINDKDLYVTEKLDGQSCTIFYNRKEKRGLFKRGVFAVCSRNIPYWEPMNNNWWNAARNTLLNQTLPVYCQKHKRSLAIQGEICGPGIQGNKLVLGSQVFYVFSIWDIEEQRYLTWSEKSCMCSELGLRHVPYVTFIDHEVAGEFTRQGFLDLAEEYSRVNPSVLQEGIVVRSQHDSSVSFKAISNEFLLKYKE